MDTAAYLRSRGRRIVGGERKELVSPSYAFRQAKKWHAARARMDADKARWAARDANRLKIRAPGQPDLAG